ncbi:MAG: APC family permease [Bifidobacteriaceae bacterium]|jgi:amino acid transporter|nr:APC family permease [Bifidobacteriaceae bacterium]
MGHFLGKLKTFILGRHLPNRMLEQTELPKRVALPVFASDALSSVAYAPDEILLSLALAGGSALYLGPWVGLAVAAVLAVVVLCYRQNAYAYPSGGGDFEVVTSNLGANAGLVVGSSLFVDYILTVAVSISSGCTYLVSMMPELAAYRTEIAIGIVVFICLMNLRGTKESGNFFSIPAYTFIATTGLLILIGLVQYFSGTLGVATSSQLEISATAGYENSLVGLGLVLLLSRAFASGNTALTGIEAISNGIPIFQPPKSKNAAKTLLMLGGLSTFMLTSILFLSNQTGLVFINDPNAAIEIHQTALGVDLGENVNANPGDDTINAGSSLVQAALTPAIGQLAQTIFPNFSAAFYLISIVTLVILFLAANTAFNGFPTLASILAQRSYLPHYLANRGSRLSLSNGIIFLTLVSGLLIAIFRADVSALIQLYVLGVFISFTLSQLSMIIHWRKHPGPRVWSKILLSCVGFVMTGTVLVIILINKFIHGAWITLLLITFLFLYMKHIQKIYRETESGVSLTSEQLANQRSDPALNPTTIQAIVLVSELNRPTVRALHYAQLTHPQCVLALHVDEDPERTQKLRQAWAEADFRTPLKIIPNPFRQTVTNVVQFISITQDNHPDQLLAIFIPEYELTKTSDVLLHSRTGEKIRDQLYHLPGVIFVTVTWPLQDDHHA